MYLVLKGRLVLSSLETIHNLPQNLGKFRL